LPTAGALFEEFDAPPARYYILTELRAGRAEIARRVWFERSELRLARIQIYGAQGRLLSDIAYGEWQGESGAAYPRNIRIVRPHDDYQLEIRVTRLVLNETIADDRFRLEQPPGTELVDLSKPENEARL
jgi:outer membrane lipoprotein-sorting protein